MGDPDGHWPILMIEGTKPRRAAPGPDAITIRQRA